MTPASLNPDAILRTGLGFFASKTLLSAVELGVHAALADGPMTRAAMEARLGLHPRASADFFDALVSLGLLAREGSGAGARYANSPDTAAFLVPSSPAYLGGMLAMANARLYGFWGNLTEALRTGQPQNEAKSGENVFGALYADPARLEQFLTAMASLQLGNFAALADQFDFVGRHVVCDAGGANGALSIALATRHPHLRCVSFDLPQVAPVAERVIAAAGLSDRIEARSGSFLTDPLPQADVIVMSNVLHDWGETTKRMLIGKAHASLPPGGAFIAIENIIDDDRRKNTLGLLMSLNMLIETPEGFDYTFGSFDGWCRDAGFTRTGRVPLHGATSAAIAWK